MMHNSLQIKLDYLTLPAVLLNNSATVLTANDAFSSLAAKTQTCLLQQLELIISNSDVCHNGYKNAHINVSSQLHYEVNIALQAGTPVVYAVLFYPLQQATGISELYASVFHHSGEAIMITDADDDIVAVNQSFVDSTGFSAKQVMYRKPDFLRSGLNEESTLQAAWQSVHQRGHWSGEIKNRKANGRYYICWLSLSKVCDDKGKLSHFVSIFSDITTHISEHKKYKKMAHYDFLTGLPNRALLEDRFEQFVLHQQRYKTQKTCACIFIDVNDFKSINDQYAHKTGDECLIAIAQAMTAAIREDDTACRFSGDEFVILLNDLTDAEDISRVTEKLQQLITQIPANLGLDKPLSVSFGVSLYPQDATDFDSLINAADKAMYTHKRNSKLAH